MRDARRLFKTSLFNSIACLLLALLLTPHTQAVVQARAGLQRVPWPQLRLLPVASGMNLPVHITHAGDGSGRLFVVEQAGRIRIIKNGIVQPTPFLDIRDRVGCCGERGLFSVAFSPAFAENGFFFVDYTDENGDTVVSRFRVHPQDPDLADVNSEAVILTIKQPYVNHNGGQLAFSPSDGYLYIGVGDGGSGGDPHNFAQSPDSLLGKLLRIDVEAGEQPYAVPPTNPFTNTAGYRGEIWALGLRNPWRFSFDRLTGDLYIGDVGQGTWEEVDYQAAGSTGGENYGWRIMEGSHCFRPLDCDPTGLTLPIAEYHHDWGCAITGGFVYRGEPFDRMQGIYFFGDYCRGYIWGLRRDENGWRMQLLYDAPFFLSTFGEDEAGNLYVADHAGGVIYELADEYRLWLPSLQAGQQASRLTGRRPSFDG